MTLKLIGDPLPPEDREPAEKRSCPKCGHEFTVTGFADMRRVREQGCENCGFPMFRYFHLLVLNAPTLRKRKTLHHLLEYGHCEEFMEWLKKQKRVKGVDY